MFSFNKPIKVESDLKKVNKIVENYIFLHVLAQSDVTKNEIIFQNIKESNFIMINRYMEQNDHKKQDQLTYIVIGFKKTIIIIEKSSFALLGPLLSTKDEMNICFLSKIDDIKNNFNKKFRIYDNKDEFFNTEIQNFNSELFDINNSELKKNWCFIVPCISGYLIKEAYEKNKINRLNNFINFEKNSESSTSNLTKIKNSSKRLPIINEDEFIELRNIGSGRNFNVILIYHIERKELYALKKQHNDDDGDEIEKLKEREIENYLKVQHPFSSKLIGIGDNNDYLIIEFINGPTLSDINELKLTFKEKITIFFEILIIIEFIHRQRFIYRDLKPNNIMVDENKTAVLIDFDRMIECENSLSTTTKNFSSSFCAPEVNGINFSYECDIYSLAYIYLHINNQDLNEFMKSNENEDIKRIINKSIKNEINERPSILQMILRFYYVYHDDIKINNLFGIYIKNFIKYYQLDKESEDIPNQSQIKAQFFFGLFYGEGKVIPFDMNKCFFYFSLAAKNNHTNAQFNLGVLYEEGKLISHDINKSIYYYSLAANQNHVEAQYYLGLLYLKDELVPLDINKGIHYLTLAADQNHAKAQFLLGLQYIKDELIPLDINKSIHYLTLAANHNISKVQVILGLIYQSDELIPRDMNKSIYYLTLAANQNNSNAQFNLGLLYEKGELIPRDENKSIYYFTLAANQNHAKAQYYLGLLYLKDGLVPLDINKSIHYLTLAANQNNSDAQFNLGVYYQYSDLNTRDINKSIHYYSLAAKQNHVEAQFNLDKLYELGTLIPRDMDKCIYYYSLAAKYNDVKAQFNLAKLYELGKLIPRDINKSIHYYSLAAKQNHAKAQFNLGKLYEHGDLIPRDINKSIHYYSLAANQNDSDAQFNLGLLYEKGKLIPRDINKSIHYYSLAANQNNSEAQFCLALIYMSFKYNLHDAKKGLYYLNFSANNNNSKSMFLLAIFNLTGLYIKKNPQNGINYLIKCLNCDLKVSVTANFIVGYFYHAGLFIKQDIKKAIHCYKEASSFNDPFAKNNLGIIYKHGFKKEIKKELGWAIQYFEEAIKYDAHYIPIYNLAHLYFYENPIENSNLESIKLLIKAANSSRFPSIFLLCIVAITEFGNDINKVVLELNKFECFSKELELLVCIIIENHKLNQPSVLKEEYDRYRHVDFIFDFDIYFSILADFFDFLKYGTKVIETKNGENIDSKFYEGFGI